MNIAQKPVINGNLGLMVWRRVSWSWQQIGFAATLALSAFLNLYALDRNGYTNEYYAAAVRSMLTSWHNFFYNAYDPGGFITIDKPPMAFWLQTASAWMFGFNGVSILLPSAIAGVVSVALVYSMVKLVFGPTAGLFAAFALAITPISVIMNRHNNPESLLILALVLAAWGMSRATERGSWTWLFFAVAMVGVGFNIKMLEAFIVLPGFYLLYLLLAPVKVWKRLVHLALAMAVLAVVSLSWAVAVDLTPADQRPYIGGSGNNTVMNLILGYNGLGRIEGNEFGGPGGNRPAGQPGAGQLGAGQPPAGFQFPGTGGTFQDGNRGGARQSGNGNANSNRQPGTGAFPGANGGFAAGNAGNNAFPGGNPGNGGFAGGRGGGNPIMAGQTGPLRMFDPQLAGEAGWLLPLALLGLVVAGVQSWRRFPPGKERAQRQRALLLWGSWLLTFMAVFSSAKGIFHSYYLVMLAPAIAALVGVSVEALWHSYRQGGWQRWLLPLALVSSAIFELNILRDYADWNRTLALVMVGVEIVAACALVALPRLVILEKPRWAAGITALALLGLMLAPMAWVINALSEKTFTNATLPTAVPAGGNAGGGFGFGFGFNRAANSLLNILQTRWNSGLSVLLFALVVLVALLAVVSILRRKLQGLKQLDRLMTAVTVIVVISFGISLALTILPAPASASSGAVTPPSTGVIGNPNMALNNNDKLIAYLEANRDGYTYLVATPSSQNASDLIIKTGQPVMALGGFMGSDQVVTAQELAQMVEDHTIRYFLLDGVAGFGGGRGGTQSATGWVQQTCKVVDSQLWSSTSTSSGSGSNQGFGNNFGGPGRGGSQGQLYDCASQG